MSLSLIPVAYAADAAGGIAHSDASGISSILLLVGFIIIFYFLLWRPQSKRAKEHRDLVSKISKGDEVVTSGGILGKVTKVSDDFIMMSISDNVEVTVQKNSISTCLPKGTMKTID